MVGLPSYLTSIETDHIHNLQFEINVKISLSCFRVSSIMDFHGLRFQWTFRLLVFAKFIKYETCCVQVFLKCPQFSIQELLNNRFPNFPFWKTLHCETSLHQLEREIRFHLRKLLYHNYMTFEYENFGYQQLNQLNTDCVYIFATPFFKTIFLLKQRLFYHYIFSQFSSTFLQC